MRPKITLIGAGSVVFAKSLIGDILQFPELSDATISLMDTDPQRLKVAQKMASSMVAQLKSTVRIEATTNRKKAVQGAHYVICTIQVGGYRPGTITDFEIPRKYGLLQTIGDTLGVGGVFRALRTIPVINGIAEDIAAVGAPNCLFLNYSNPMAMNCWAVDKGVGIPHVGLCHSVQGTSQQLASYAKLPAKDVTYLVAGINHMAFFLKFEYRGQDAYPLLFKLLDDPSFTHDKVRFEMMRRTGYFVTESSEHQSEYVPYFIHHGKEVIQQFDIPIDEYLRRCKTILATWREMEKKLLGEKGRIPIAPRSHEYGSFIIHSRETNTPRVIYGNVPNRDLISNLPEGCCVEVPCLVDAQGLQPIRIGNLPPQLAALCRTNVNVQELTVEAALTKKREHIYHAVMLDPHTATVLTMDKIWAMCDELIAAHQKHGLLGEFRPVLRNTGRGFEGTGDRVLAKILPDDKSLSKKTRHSFRLSVENPRLHPVQATFQLRSQPPALRLKKKGSLSLKIPAQKTAELAFEIEGNIPEGQTVHLLLSTPTSDVLALGYVMNSHRRLKINENGSAHFNLELAGFPAGEGEVSLKKEAVHVALCLHDSKIETTKGVPWSGSCVELFFAPPQGGQPIQFFCVPQKGKTAPRILARASKKAEGIQATQRIQPGSYRMEVTLPFKSIGFKPETRQMLFDVIANLTALGDAHSGGRTSLGGSFESWQTSGHYSLVDFNSTQPKARKP